jgi:hypothetical protein
MQPLDLASLVKNGRKVTVLKGAYKGRTGSVIERLTPDDTQDDSLITGMCRYALDLGERSADGQPNAVDFCRFEFKVHAVERKPRRANKKVA